MSKAFYKVWHDGVLFKLERNDTSGNLRKIFKDVLDIAKRENLSMDQSDSKSSTKFHVLRFIFFFIYIPTGNYMFKVNNRNTRTSIFIVNFEHISNFVLVFLLVTLNM